MKSENVYNFSILDFNMPLKMIPLWFINLGTNFNFGPNIRLSSIDSIILDNIKFHLALN